VSRRRQKECLLLTQADSPSESLAVTR
jgi:hypothetical protein